MIDVRATWLDSYRAGTDSLYNKLIRSVSPSVCLSVCLPICVSVCVSVFHCFDILTCLAALFLCACKSL